MTPSGGTIMVKAKGVPSGIIHCVTVLGEAGVR